MDKETKERMELYKHDFMVLHNYFSTLYKATKTLSDVIFKYGSENLKLKQLQIAEVYSTYSSAKLFMDIKLDLYESEFSSYLSAWEDLYREIVEVAEDDDSNTTWMSSRFDLFEKQYQTVDKMLNSRQEELNMMTK